MAFYSSGRSLPVARCWATARRASTTRWPSFSLWLSPFFYYLSRPDPSGPRLGDQASVSPTTARAIGGPQGALCPPDRSTTRGDGSPPRRWLCQTDGRRLFYLCSDPSGSLRGTERAGFHWNPPFIPLVRSRDLTRETGKGIAHGVALPLGENGRKNFPPALVSALALVSLSPRCVRVRNLTLLLSCVWLLLSSWGGVVEDTVPRTFDIKVS